MPALQSRETLPSNPDDFLESKIADDASAEFLDDLQSNPTPEQPKPPAEIVEAARSPRQPPKADRLSPKDLAKAFQLGYEPPLKNLQRGKWRGLKFLAIVALFSAAAALAVRNNPIMVQQGIAWVQVNVLHNTVGGSNPAPAESAAAPPAPAVAVDVPTDPSDDVNQLWNAALDAESRRDFAAAVKIYQRIQSLPRDSWPAGLRTRMELARQQMLGDTR